MENKKTDVKVEWTPEEFTDWSMATRKKLRERQCRVDKKHKNGLQAAHTINRAKQDVFSQEILKEGWAEDEFGRLYWKQQKVKKRIVPPEAIVPLCVDCHMAYDAHKLNLLPYMTLEEQANAVLAVGMIAAMRRCTSGL